MGMMCADGMCGTAPDIDVISRASAGRLARDAGGSAGFSTKAVTGVFAVDYASPPKPVASILRNFLRQPTRHVGGIHMLAASARNPSLVDVVASQNDHNSGRQALMMSMF